MLPLSHAEAIGVVVALDLGFLGLRAGTRGGGRGSGEGDRSHLWISVAALLNFPSKGHYPEIHNWSGVAKKCSCALVRQSENKCAF